MHSKVSFNGAYAGERGQILLMNKLLEGGQLAKHLNKNAKYHHIDLEEFEMKRTRGFFGYVFEDMAVFEDSFNDAMKRLPQFGDGGSRPAPRREQGTRFARRRRTNLFPSAVRSGEQ